MEEINLLTATIITLTGLSILLIICRSKFFFAIILLLNVFSFSFVVFYRQKLLCDVTLVADSVEIPAHKMVLAACSPYFYAMFTSFEESKQDRITLQGVDHYALSLLVEYVYTSEVHVTEENVQVFQKRD